jgi:hypothetical protein
MSDFECNVCLESARSPVVTRCGHMFCWECLYKWAQQSHSPSCPVCKAALDIQQVTPIYGRGATHDPRNTVPERPRAQRPPSPQHSRFGGDWLGAPNRVLSPEERVQEYCSRIVGVVGLLLLLLVLLY